jgi:hypothetical protein
MTDTAPDPLARLIRDFGAGWQIRHDAESGIWTALACPTRTARHVLAARSPAELEAKIEAAQPGGPRGSGSRPTVVPPLTPSAGFAPGQSERATPAVTGDAGDAVAQFRGQDIADLRWHWGEAYDITWDGRFRAVRQDGGGSLDAGTAQELHALIRSDYIRCPVPRPP